MMKLACPDLSLRSLAVWRRNFLVWRKLAIPSLLGNLADRIVFGKVTDFLQMWLFRSIPITWPWPTFNVADVLLLAGVGCLMIFSFMPESKGLWGTSKPEKIVRK
ncbi:MAG: hypothetical protein CVU59_10010 [Deltaproteobacteria bacterium HGW-Deltaproteobacteria-17]|nr:MAG: hypothetical protein CVU59_10010 [Deltaproteobacteria bacterium HGW-Deltaproteobacteria-17]